LSDLLELAGVRQAAAMSTTRRRNLPVFTLSVRVAAVYRIENRLSISKPSRTAIPRSEFA